MSVLKGIFLVKIYTQLDKSVACACGSEIPFSMIDEHAIKCIQAASAKV
jgi:hypothetical protein